MTAWTRRAVWHLIGHLQKNKVKYIADKVSMIHSVDSVELAKEIDRQCAKICKVMDVLIEVNVSGEQSKSGIEPKDALKTAEEMSKFPHLRVKGLMTMAPLGAKMMNYTKFFQICIKFLLTYRQKN